MFVLGILWSFSGHLWDCFLTSNHSISFGAQKIDHVNIICMRLITGFGELFIISAFYLQLLSPGYLNLHSVLQGLFSYLDYA